MHIVHNTACAKLHNVHTGSYGMQSSIPEDWSQNMSLTPEQFASTREDLGLTQAEMGMRLGGYSWRTVASWESGDRGIPPAVESLLTALEQKERLMEAIMDLLTKRPLAIENAKQEIAIAAGMEYRDYLKRFKDNCAVVDGVTGGGLRG